MSIFRKASANEAGVSLLFSHYGGDSIEDMDFGEDAFGEDAFGSTDEEEDLGLDAEEDDDLELPIGGALFSGLPEEEEAEVSAPVLTEGRLGMARRVRSGLGADRFGAGYIRGVQDALAHSGVSDSDLQARLSLLWGDSVVGGSTPSAVPDVFGAMSRSKPLAESFMDGASAIEADSADLPPVYVADTIGIRANVASGEHFGSQGAFPIEEHFGDAVLAGYVGKQNRGGSRLAAERSIAGAAKRSAVTQPSNGAPFVEDTSANPHLFSDGSILDAVYGKLRVMPCPSCSSCSAKDVQAGHAKECGVCDAYGAVLVPETDAEHWVGVRYGFLVPLLVGLGGVLLEDPEIRGRVTGAIDQVTGRPKPAKKKKKRIASSLAAVESVEAPLEEAPEVARAIVPERWFEEVSAT